MDDEKPVRDIMGSMLNFMGYQVDFAKEGKELLDIYNQCLEKQEKIRFLIMDLTIPGGMGGKETMAKLKEIDPDVNVIVSRGYSNDKILSKYKEYGFCGVLSKPFRIEEVNEVITQIETNNCKIPKVSNSYTERGIGTNYPSKYSELI